MQKLLLFSHNGFSDTGANGITMKNLLSAWLPEEKAEFYCDVEKPDFSAAHHYFRVSDSQMIKALLGKKSQHVFTYSPEQEAPGEGAGKSAAKATKKIPGWLKKYKYNFCLKWAREYLWMLSPWGHRKLKQWIRDFDPDVIVYMVGESIFMDQLVLKVCRETGKPLVLYSGEAYRIIDLKQRRGLERAYYRKVERLYGKLNDAASLVIYNCEMLKNEYETMYPPKAESMIAYNSADCVQEPYEPGESMNITYFGNLGVGRSDVLLETAEILGQIDESLVLDIYGNAPAGYEERFRSCKNIRYNGFVNPEELRQIIGRSDILLHVESFDEKIVPKLKYAFSTKIAQCLCSGRCFVSYAPSGTASSRYLQSVGGAAMVSRREELKELLGRLVSDPVLRRDYAEKALAVGRKNHQKENTARQIRERVERIV
jgi:glycosyltransferase involved in cell wall biosynthesis